MRAPTFVAGRTIAPRNGSQAHAVLPEGAVAPDLPIAQRATFGVGSRRRFRRRPRSSSRGRQLRHSTIGFVSPVEFEARYHQRVAAVAAQLNCPLNWARSVIGGPP